MTHTHLEAGPLVPPLFFVFVFPLPPPRSGHRSSHTPRDQKLSAQLEFNKILQHYRGRNEHLIRQMEAGKEGILGKIPRILLSIVSIDTPCSPYDGVARANEGSAL